MDRTLRHAAARNSLAAMALTFLWPSLPALADGPPQLILPLVTAIAFASAATSPANGLRGSRTLDRELLGLLPDQFRIPDLYKVDAGDYILRGRPEAPVDADTYFSIDLLPRRRQGWMPSMVYDEETRGPLAGSNMLFRIEFEKRW